MRAIAVTLLGLAACSLRPYAFDASATDSGGTSSATTTTIEPTTGSSSTGLTTTSTGPGSSTSTTTGDATTGPPAPDAVAPECGPWMQECPEGQKCMPYNSGGDNFWDSWKCVDLVPNPVGVDETCMVFGEIASGEDSCDEGLMCWYLDWGTGEGTCVAICGGTPEAPTCPDPWVSCTIGADAFLILCLPDCNPLTQNCGTGDLCIPNREHFICVLDASGDEGQPLDPCEYANACDPGLACLGPEFAVECDPLAIGCCIPFCDITQPNTCPGQGQECLPWFEPGMGPPDLANLGICALPGP